MSNLSKRKGDISSTAESLLSPFRGLHQEVNRAMSDLYNLFESSNLNLEHFHNLRLSPAMDIIEDKDCLKIEIEIEMPGMDEKDIKISISDNVITIQGEKSTSKKDENKNYLSREISYGRYDRTITLPQSVDVDKAKASFKKGMLWVTIPKKAESKGKLRELNINKE
ncbi:Hsp20/alpha crystallin family protein [Legionella sp. 29fVS95]|uniref:Hsp20/alpha crystallin family protein n=1 Tax=Legionella sp. 29fVS95 TaxID=3402813 RepID=UPI003AF7CA23